MQDNNLRISFDYKYPDEAALVVYSAFGGGYLIGGEPTINVKKVITGEEAVELYAKLVGETVKYVKDKAGYIQISTDLNKQSEKEIKDE